jgi:hypothetical protein
MSKFQKGNLILFIRFMVVLFCFLYLGSGYPFAQELGVVHKGQNSIEKADLVIQYKTEESVISRDRRFSVSSSTLIYSHKGRQMMLYDLPVPCKAVIEYKPAARGNPRAVKITILQKFPGAKTGWLAPEPE